MVKTNEEIKAILIKDTEDAFDFVVNFENYTLQEHLKFACASLARLEQIILELESVKNFKEWCGEDEEQRQLTLESLKRTIKTKESVIRLLRKRMKEENNDFN